MPGGTRPETGWCRFPTGPGDCGLAWSRTGIRRVMLPGDAAVAPLPGVAGIGGRPPFVDAAIAGIRDLLEGRPADLAAVPLDLDDRTPFTRRVLEVARSIPRGTTTTYGALAARAGRPGAARAAGQAMAHNPVPLLVPCHRVLASDGRMCGFSAPGGIGTKRRLLAIEARATEC